MLKNSDDQPVQPFIFNFYNQNVYKWGSDVILLFLFYTTFFLFLFLIRKVIQSDVIYIWVYVDDGNQVELMLWQIEY